MTSAAGKLNPLQPSEQLEALGYDIDLTDLTLALQSRASLSVIEMLTDGTIDRTIEGASTLTLTLRDRDLIVRKSGLLAKDTSVKVDGLWFRLVNVDAQGNDIRLTFEDREVNVLRQFPLADAPHNGFLAVSVDKTNRVAFAKRLVDEPGQKGVLEIAFRTGPSAQRLPPITQSSDKPSPAEKQQQKTPGLPKGKVTVKRVPVIELQRQNLERVLDVGYSMNVGERALRLAVMTVTQESTALNKTGYGMCTAGGNALGMFQQCPGGGRPDGKGGWPASMDIEKDAHAYFEVAVYALTQASLGPVTDGWVCSWIQRDYTYGKPNQGANYQQWDSEATVTVGLYLGEITAEPVKPAKPAAGDKVVVPPFTPGAAAGDTARMFTRGTRTTKGTQRKQYKRETNWDALQRLASEVQWRCFCVSGTVFFISEPDLFLSNPLVTLVPWSPGVDAIDGSYDVGQHNATVTVSCRADRWQAPPGTVVLLDETGLFDGRWIVTSIQRSLFSPAMRITLKKPRPALPESSAPEYGQGQSSGTVASPPPKTAPPDGPRGGKTSPPGPSGTVSGYRDPFRDVTSLMSARIDMGVDYASANADPIYAIGPAVIADFTLLWLGGGPRARWYGVSYTFTDGPAKGLTVFLAEYITFTSNWVRGQKIDSNTVLAHFVAGTNFEGNGIETGWAQSGTTTPMALPIYPGGGRRTAFGQDFSHFLSLLNARNAGSPDLSAPGDPVGALPGSWPTWRKDR